MATAQELQSRLSVFLGEESVLPSGQASRFAVEGRLPGCVVQPSSQEQVAQVLALASGEGLGVIPWGNGTLQELGNPPRRTDLVLALGRLGRAVDHRPGDLTVTLDADVTLGQLQEALTREGQFLPLDPPLGQESTVGGVLATALPGPLSLAYGTARDWVLGLRVAGSQGEVTKSGGQVVKNVTGLDVHKLHLGALGTLGVILEASLKVAPLPQADVSVRASFPDMGPTLEAAAQLLAWPVQPQALEALHAEGPEGEREPTTLLLRLMGRRASVEERKDAAGALLRDAGAEHVEVVGGETTSRAWRRIIDFGWDSHAGHAALVRLGCRPSRVGQMALAVRALVQSHGWPADLLVSPGRGLLRCFLPLDSGGASSALRDGLAGLQSLSLEAGGYCVVERGPTEVKEGLDVWGAAPEDLTLMRRLKAEMDPRGVLNPGRFVGGI